MTREENLKFREEVIKKQFKNALGYELNLDNPKTFNEKIQWLKLYYHDPLTTICADKYLVRGYIKEKIGEEYLIPLLGVWDKVDDIDFDSLPNQFVLKVNWGSGQNIIVKDKSKLNIEETKNKLRYWMQPFCNLYYYYSFEWQYKNIPPKIICEKYIEQSNESIIDYKFYCFNGEPYFIHIVSKPHTNDTKVNMYNMNWEKLDLIYDNHKNIEEVNKEYKPSLFDLMIELSKKLSNNFFLVRVDFIIVDNKVYFGELTFTPSNGVLKFTPIEWDYKFGELLELPKEKKIEYDFIDKNTLFNQLYNLEIFARQYKIMEMEINRLKNNNVSKLNEEIKKLKIENNNLLSNYNKFDLFSIYKNEKYLRITLFGIKLTLKIKK